MQVKPKYIVLGIFTLIVFVGLSVRLDWWREYVDSDEKITQRTNNTNTGDTLERLKIHSGSDTKWGPSPFASGAPLSDTGTDSEKKVFQKPNTEWKTRTISGVTYVFGEGNPKEVALTREKITKLKEDCNAPFSEKVRLLLEDGSCDAESGNPLNISVDVEKYLYKALSDPNWEKLATECEMNFRSIEAPDAILNAEQDPTFLTYDRVFGSGFLDIQNFLNVNVVTGRKEFSWVRAHSLIQFLAFATLDGPRGGNGLQNVYGDCVDQYVKEIARNLSLAMNMYRGISTIETLNQSGSIFSNTWKFPQ